MRKGYTVSMNAAKGMKKKMNRRLKLAVPELPDLWYRKRMMEDPATMSYNRGYDLSFEGYDRETGCIAFPESEWAEWYDAFIARGAPKRFYAYVVRLEDGAWIGEVNLHESGEPGIYDMGVVIEARYRGQGYAREALELLLGEAFDTLHARAVRNDFERERTAALRAHMDAGFTLCGEEKGIVRVEIAREAYEHKRVKA